MTFTYAVRRFNKMDRRWLHRILLLLCIGSLAVAAEEGNGSGGGDDSAGSTSGPSPDSGEKKKEVLECISCRNCKIFEVTSHSIKCDAESTMCMVNIYTDSRMMATR